MNKLCDLHTHSTFSDGSCTPTEIIDAACQIGLSAVALCDHNTVDGLPEFLSAAENKNIKAIPGAEFSVDFNGTELHLLGLYIPPKAFQQVTDFMFAVNKRKEESNLALVSSLNKAGYLIDYDVIKEKFGNGVINRAHIGEELMANGYVNSVKEAFNTLLKPEHGHYQPPKRLTVWEMIDFIVSVGALPVLAHPFNNLNKEELKRFLPIAKERGLVGMECFYSEYDEETTKKSIELADLYQLKYSGGSDFHGARKPDIKLGSGTGNLKIPYDWALALNK